MKKIFLFKEALLIGFDIEAFVCIFLAAQFLRANFWSATIRVLALSLSRRFYFKYL